MQVHLCLSLFDLSVPRHRLELRRVGGANLLVEPGC
jgi:hypothetical protein